MASAFFRFKQFTVWHDKCAMKVGTDGVLLGAWCPIGGHRTADSGYRVLDIGTGSGLIALMLAQRVNRQGVWIDAIDIDADAVMQAQENFAKSPWADMLHAHQSSLQNWFLATTSSTIHPTCKKYDLIVSNPPYFQQSLKNPDAQRAMARHTDSLSYASLLEQSARLLKDDGILSLVLPIEAAEEIMYLAAQNGLSPTRITYVHSKPTKPPKRLLICFCNSKQIEGHASAIPQHFYIESDTAPRSEEYQALTKDFYL